MSALSGGQEITSAFSRSLYYATPQIHPLSHVHTYTYTQTHTLNSCVSSHTSIKVYVCIYIFVYMCRVHNLPGFRTRRPRTWVSTCLNRRYVCTQAVCVPRGMAEIPRANNNATSCKWDGYPYTCRRDDV